MTIEYCGRSHNSSGDVSATIAPQCPGRLIAHRWTRIENEEHTSTLVDYGNLTVLYLDSMPKEIPHGNDSAGDD